MYRSFTATNYRCFESMTVKPLGAINLITGKNNVGKTALLEALFLHCGAYNPSLVMRVDAFRGIDAFKIELSKQAAVPWSSIFRGFDISKTVELVGENTQTGTRLLQLRAIHDPSTLEPSALEGSYPLVAEETDVPPSASEPRILLELAYESRERKGTVYLVLDSRGIRVVPHPPAPPFPTFFQGDRVRIPLADDAERFGHLEIAGRQDVLLQFLRIIEPRLKRLAVIVTGGQAAIHGDIGIGRLVPLPVMGGGIARLAGLVLSISNASNGVVLIDEIENGLHYSVLMSVWLAVAEAAREFGTQVFATTHSLECIKAAHEAFAGDVECDFRLHRLEKTDDGIRAVTFSRKQLATAIATDLEVR